MVLTYFHSQLVRYWSTVLDLDEAETWNLCNYQCGLLGNSRFNFFGYGRSLLQRACILTTWLYNIIANKRWFWKSQPAVLEFAFSSNLFPELQLKFRVHSTGPIMPSFENKFHHRSVPDTFHILSCVVCCFHDACSLWMRKVLSE